MSGGVNVTVTGFKGNKISGWIITPTETAPFEKVSEWNSKNCQTCLFSTIDGERCFQDPQGEIISSLNAVLKDRLTNQKCKIF